MTDKKSTKLTIHEDRPTGISSSAFHSNIDAMGFNILFIASKKPKLAVEIMKLYEEARKIREDDPIAPDEDFDLFSRELSKLSSDNTQDKS